MSFLRINNLAEFPKSLRGGAVAIGNFDGLHRGHQSVLEAASTAAEQCNCPAIVLTFEPHPRSVFQPDVPLPRITPPSMKAKMIEELGFDAVIELPFSREFSKKSADEFVSDILLGSLNASNVVTGFDFHFGKDRQGGPAFLINEGKKNGFEVILVDAFRDDAAEVISSSRIREALGQGDVSLANSLLGYHYRVAEQIIEGEKLGRTLGYPTANMSVPAETPLLHGIYAVRFIRADGSIYDGVASYGRRPTVTDNGKPLLETYLFDFKEDLYGEKCSVAFVAYLRGEEKFEGLDPLIAQMKIDEQNARMALAQIESLSALDSRLTFGGEFD